LDKELRGTRNVKDMDNSCFIMKCGIDKGGDNRDIKEKKSEKLWSKDFYSKEKIHF
jgi:hypothetical protein